MMRYLRYNILDTLTNMLPDFHICISVSLKMPSMRFKVTAVVDHDVEYPVAVLKVVVFLLFCHLKPNQIF